jgi:hypothetical protein
MMEAVHKQPVTVAVNQHPRMQHETYSNPSFTPQREHF